MAKKDLISEKVQKGYLPFESNGLEKGRLFKRKSKGTLERESRRWGFRKVKNRIELVHV